MSQPTSATVIETEVNVAPGQDSQEFSTATLELIPAPTIPLAATPEPSPTLTPTLQPTPTRSPDPRVEQAIAGMSTEQKIGQMLLMGVDGGAITGTTCGRIQSIAPGGIVYRTANAVSPEQLRQFSAGLQQCARSSGITPLWIAIDHEGQYVTRFDGGMTVFPAAMAIGATGKPENAFQAAYAAGRELAFSGVNMVLGPVADVLTNYDNRVISQRSFGGDPGQVSQFVAQAVDGYLQAGLTPVLKHFPGHGGVADDTHAGVVQDPADRRILEQDYLPPFQAGIQAGAPVVMFGHVAFPGIDPAGKPSSLSPPVVSLLRDEMGFKGVILTDSLGMGAITSSSANAGEAAVESVLAGVDMLLTTSSTTTNAAYQGLLEAVKNNLVPAERLDASVRRILQAKAQSGLMKEQVADSGVINEPDWQANQQLAYQIGNQAVAVLKDETGLVPIPADYQRILIVGPVDGWGLYPALEIALQNAGHSTYLVTYPAPWDGRVNAPEHLQQLPGLSNQFDLVLALTWQAHLNRLDSGDTWQGDLLQALQATGKPLVVVGLKSPTDLLELPQLPVYLATYGTTPGQVQALADALAGGWIPVGRSPLPGLP